MKNALKKLTILLSWKNLLIWALASLVAVLCSCSADSEGTGASEVPASTPNVVRNPGYRITGFVMNGENVQSLEFGEVTQGESESAIKIARQNGLLELQDVTFSSPNVPNPRIGPSVTATAPMNDLARMALSECGQRAGSILASARNGTSCQYLQFVSGRPYESSAMALSSAMSPAASFTPLNVPPSTSTPSCSPNSSPAFLFFKSEPATAQQVLQFSETLVCAAGKLAELAESDKPTVWEFGLYGLGMKANVASTLWGAFSFNVDDHVVDLPTYPPIMVPLTSPDALLPSQPKFPPVTFNVVQLRDRFLVRNLAMELLSYVPLVDQFPIRIPTATGASASTPLTRSSSELFAQTAAIGSATPNAAQALLLQAAYNVSATNPVTTTNAGWFYPPISMTNTATPVPDYTRTARQHLEMQTANLRAASQLLADLAQKNVRSAYAGALQKAA
jgi:hypothetical protein